MNVLLNTLIIFLFIVITVSANIPRSNKDNYIQNKWYLFIGITLLQICVLMIDRVYSKCKIKTLDLIKESIKVGLVSVIGYSIYVDILFMETLRESYKGYIDVPKKNVLFVSGIISLFVFVYKIIDNLVFPIEC